MSNSPRQTRAYVLHTYPYRESSLLLECFTQDYGRISVLAKGAKRPKSPLRSSLQAFSLLELQIQGRQALKLLTAVDVLGQAKVLGAQAQLCGLYINELLLRLLPKHDPYVSLFEVYHSTLEALCERAHRAVVLRCFEKSLLQALGYGLPLTRTVDGEPLVKDAYYRYVPAEGFYYLEPHCSAAGAYCGEVLLAIAASCWEDPIVLQEAKRLLRCALSDLLGEKPLKSRELIQAFYALPGERG
jgi:DNA repair protein RecO (recombination protein O)